ncbi:MAG: hypothetical protein SangKO_075560 [Sandaracinaceae bacterium]
MIVVSLERGQVVIRIGLYTVRMCPVRAIQVAHSIAQIAEGGLAQVEQRAKLAKEITDEALNRARRGDDA